MRIRSMTATFGKLEHATLTFEPGLNVIEAPNEWGKSTWCAFLSAMLYGMDTRAKTTKTALADKERYLPWSGSPMSGRMDLTWKGRNITIERKTKGRVPLGMFSAYETETGIAVPELTAANCGDMLLGVEKAVFLRSAFIRHSDLPVAQEEHLRNRLNALVTTGDDSGDGEKLEKALKELKNRCRYNRTGLLPQAEAQKAQLEGKLRDLENMEAMSQRNAQRLSHINDWIAQLENHKTALRYEAARKDADKVAQAESAAAEAELQLSVAKFACQGLPPRDQAEQALAQLRKLELAQQDLQMEAQMLPAPPQPPQVPDLFRGTDPEDAVKKADEDKTQYENLAGQRNLLPLFGFGLLILGIAALFWKWIPGVLCMLGGAGFLVAGLLVNSRKKRAMARLEDHYGTDDPESWVDMAEEYRAALMAAEDAQQKYQSVHGDLSRRQQALHQRIQAVTEGLGMEAGRNRWQSIADTWDRYADAHRDAQRARGYCTTLASMVKAAEKPAMPDTLTYTESETARLLSDANTELQVLRSQAGQNQGRMETLGTRSELETQLTTVNKRIRALEDTYAALTIALETLAEAGAELQRRFAPQIAARAQELFARFTGGRYDRLTLRDDLSLRAAAQNEDTLHDAIWRSDGTVDQLYLALRLAVAEALSPHAPLILDDALVRFDDVRLKATLEILKDEAQQKQILLFTCQSREQNLL